MNSDETDNLPDVENITPPVDAPSETVASETTDDTAPPAPPETPPETDAAPAAEVNPAKAEAKLEKNEKLLVGYEAELAALDPDFDIRKGQLEKKIADLKKQIEG